MWYRLYVLYAFVYYDVHTCVAEQDYRQHDSKDENLLSSTPLTISEVESAVKFHPLQDGEEIGEEEEEEERNLTTLQKSSALNQKQNLSRNSSLGASVSSGSLFSAASFR